MDQTFNLWLGVIVIFVLGALFHFLYDLTHQTRPLGLFSAVNESTWEHIKIAITPTLLWSCYDGYLYGNNPNYFCAKLLSLLVLVFFIPLVFYVYMTLTLAPLKNIIFKDPITGKYGFRAHRDFFKSRSKKHKN